MSSAEAARLEGLRPQDWPVVVLEGDPAEAVERFPANVNVAVALAWATRGRPTGPAGRLELTFASAPSSDNPRTSQLTALSVTRTVRRARGLTPGG